MLSFSMEHSPSRELGLWTPSQFHPNLPLGISFPSQFISLLKPNRSPWLVGLFMLCGTWHLGYCVYLCVSSVGPWWGLNTLPQNRTPWCTEHFKLKEFEKRQMQEDLADLPSSLPFEIQHKILGWEVSLPIFKMEGCREESKETGLAKMPPPLLHLAPTLFVLSYFPITSHLHRT